MQRNLGITTGILMFATVLAAALPASAGFKTFQQGLDGYTGAQDTQINGDNRNGGAGQLVNNSGLIRLGIFERELSLNNSSRALIRFDSLGAINTATLGGASLTVTINDNNGGKTVTWSLFALTPANAAWTAPHANWINRDNSGPSPWAGSSGLDSPGVDYVATAIDTLTMDNTKVAGTQMTFNFSPAALAILADWIDNPSNNAGFFLRQNGPLSDVELNRNDGIHSSEAATVALRPFLTLALPEPASAGLLGLGLMVLARRRGTR